MYLLSGRARKISPSATLALDAKVKELISQGKPVLNFGVGEPDFPTPQNIKDAAIAAINSNFTKYTPVSGTQELRKAIAEKFSRENNIQCAPENIVVSCGGKHSLYNTFQAVLEPEDEVIIPRPYWVSYVEQAKLSGGVPVICEAEGFRIKADLIEEKLSDKTKMVVLNSPNNPSGAVCGKSDLKRIADLIIGKGLLLISDEVYEHFVFGDSRHISVASLSDEISRRTVTINSASKTYCMTGWRIGYLCAPKEMAKAIGDMQSHSTSNPTSIAQKAALEALTGPQDSVGRMAEEFGRRGLLMQKRLNQIPGISCAEPQGAFYCFPSIEATGLGSAEFCRRLLEEKLVAAVPGEAFGMDSNIRLSYATSTETINKGMDILDVWVKGL